jgi:hypothetical protein
MKFWLANWVGGTPLASLFPRLFSLSLQKESLIEELFLRDGVEGHWSFLWRRNLFQWDSVLLQQLIELLESVTLSLVDDSWVWLPDPEGTFSTNSAYKYLAEELHRVDELEPEVALVFYRIWESPVPSKAIAFSWKLLHDRIPTRDNLDFRHILAPDAPRNYVGCVGVVESSIHLFLHCSSAMEVWYELFRLWELSLSYLRIYFCFLKCLGVRREIKKIRQGFLLIWHATLWSIWRVRNNTIFTNGSFNSKVLVDDVKVLSWKWSLARLKIPPCLFYEWQWDPGDCLMR